MLAVIPARGGSKGLPGKNIRSLAGLPLIAHSILLSRLCPQITRTIVSTDSQEIAEVARQYGAEVPFMRPPELAQDDTPMWPVLQHVLGMAEAQENRRYEYLLLLDPTSPGRLPEDIAGALAKLAAMPGADGIIGVSQPEFNPIWHCVVEHDGWLETLFPSAGSYARRQDVPTVYRINATLYLWRTEFVRREPGKWMDNGKHLIYEIPEKRAIHIDDINEFSRTEALIRQGFISLPWLESKEN